mmetsp:Transcript_167105/g.536688  ORF Transcript_167105/g.536688 Transcript_167105/m.536688 type:complete len:248 (+) Transcript_167105:1358-2101(+)
MLGVAVTGLSVGTVVVSVGLEAVLPKALLQRLDLRQGRPEGPRGELAGVAAAGQLLARQHPLDGLEVGQNTGIAPLLPAAELATPPIEILRRTAHPHGVVQTAGSAEPLAALEVDDPALGQQLRLTRGAEAPVRLAADEAPSAAGVADPSGVLHLASRFQHQHPDLRVLGQSGGQDAAGAARSHDDEVPPVLLQSRSCCQEPPFELGGSNLRVPGRTLATHLRARVRRKRRCHLRFAKTGTAARDAE